MPVALSLTVILTATGFSYSQGKRISQINISSGWGGLGPGQHSELTISRSVDGYHVNGDPVADRLVADLVRAIDEPTVRRPTLSNFGINKRWLAANAREGIREYAEEYFSKAAPNLQQLYFSSFNDIRLIAQLLPSRNHVRWTDDYPSIELTLRGEDGGIVKVSSEAQPLFMLPWKIVRNGRVTRTYNAHISRALARLLPKDFVNKERLVGEGLKEELARAVMHHIEDDWNRLDAENKAGDYLNHLREQFVVIASEINGYHNVDYGREWSDRGPTEFNLQVTLKRKDFPKNFVVTATLPFKDGRVENVQTLLNEIDRFKSLVQSVPWLRNYVTHHRRTRIELRFVNNRSFGDKPMESFAQDMDGLQKSTLSTEVRTQKEAISLINVNYDTFWLVLADKRMVLWRSKGERGLLKWKTANFHHEDCTAYRDYPYAQCFGAVISPYGMISSN
jgi:hypothetical protein